MNHIKEVRDFVVTNFLFGDASSLNDDTSFLESGIKIEPEEMLPENLDSVNKVAQFIARKQSKAAAA
jgi:hypothetical protein